MAFSGVRQEDKELAMELCGMSLLEVEDFLDDKRTHMTEGIIIGQVAVPRPDSCNIAYAYTLISSGLV